MPVLNPSSNVQADSTTGLPIEQKSTSNAAWVMQSTSQGNLPYPLNAVALTGSSGNVAAATATATLTAVAGKTTYITGFEITGSGATLGSVVTATVTGTITGTLSYTVSAIAGALLENTPLIVQFSVPIPASAANTNIVVSCPSLGTGNTNSTVVAHGYNL